MTISIAAVLTMIGVPSFRYVTNSNRIAGEVNGLLGDLQFARSEAIKEGQYVTVCQSTDNATCTGLTDWRNGWIVFSNPTNAPNPAALSILRIQTPFSGTDTFAATNGISVITFNREGYAGGIPTGTLISLHDSTNTHTWTRCLSVNLNGMTTTLKYDGATCI